jgi:phospholipase C
MSGRNIGDQLTDWGITWGWFQGGFKPTSRNEDGTAVCASTHANIAGISSTDYVPHHQPFQYWQSTSNPHHLPPSAVDMIGWTDAANHQYDLEDFWNTVDSGHMPAVSYLKAAAYQDGHASNSTPLDEQRFVVETINRLMQRPEWVDMAIIITYDDSDGWYDHVMPPIVSQSATPMDALTGTGRCGTPAPGVHQGRCGFGPRLPLLVISPYARVNHVDHTLTNQASVVRFIEENWKIDFLGDQSFDEESGTLMNLFDFRANASRVDRLLLDAETGQPVRR